MKDKKIIFEVSDKFNFSDCELETVSDEKFKNNKGVRFTDKNLCTDKLFLTKANDDWSGYDYLQISAYSKRASGTAAMFYALTGNSGEAGYVYPIIVSWSDKKILTFPLKKGILTDGNPVHGLDFVTGYKFKAIKGGTAAGETELTVDEIWLTNNPVPDKERFIEADENEDYYVEGLKNQKYDAVSLLKERFPNKAHPRLILTSDDFDNLKRYVKDIPFMKNVYKDVKGTADEALSLPVSKHVLEDGRRLTRVPLNYIPPLILTYIISGEKKYKDRAWQELESVCRFPDWNQAHDIDVGDTVCPVALAYDWLYDEWTEREKRIMRNAMLKNAFEAEVIQFRDKSGIATYDGNHNTVTFSSIGLAALAIADEDGCEDIANEIINGAAEAVPYNLKTFAPYGVCTEGPGYWDYGQCTFYRFEAAMITALGTDFGLKALQGLDITGDYLMAMHGTSGQCFNYSDTAEETTVAVPSLMWITQLYNKYEYAQFYLENRTSKGNYHDMLFFREEMLKKKDFEGVKTDYFMGNIGCLRSSQTDKNGIYVAFKGGKREDHMDLDFGTFVLDMLGERWITELGREAYDMPGMWDYGADAGRWNYYRKRAEGNNTLVINPEYSSEHTADLYPYADCNIISSESQKDFAQCTLDLTSAYPEIAERVTRTFALTENRSVFELTDVLELKQESKIYSFFHTKADIELISKNTAVLTQNGKSIRLEVISDAGAELLVMEAESIFDEVTQKPHKDNSEYRKLAIKRNSVKNTKITVTIKENIK